LYTFCSDGGDEELGRGKFELDVLLDERRDCVRDSVKLEDKNKNKIGTLVVSLKGYEALQSAVSTGKRGSRR